MAYEPSPLLRRLLEASAASPLTEADPSSLDELMRRVQVTFDMKPLDLSDDDIITNITYYRAKIAKLGAILENQPKKSPSTRGTSAKKKLAYDDEVPI